MRSVDLVVVVSDATGATATDDDRSERRAAAAAEAAMRRGDRVLIVLRSGDARACRRLRYYLRRQPSRGRLSVISNADVVCVDGVDRVEAVVIRSLRTGRLVAVNTAAFIDADRP